MRECEEDDDYKANLKHLRLRSSRNEQENRWNWKYQYDFEENERKRIIKMRLYKTGGCFMAAFGK